MPLRQDLTVYQGQTFSKTYAHYEGGSLADLTGYTARMKVRTRFGGSARAYLSTGADADGGTLTIDGGTVTIAMTAADTDALATGVDLAELMAGEYTPRREQFVYDLELVNGATVTRAIEGVIELHRGVTT